MGDSGGVKDLLSALYVDTPNSQCFKSIKAFVDPPYLSKYNLFNVSYWFLPRVVCQVTNLINILPS